VNTIESRSFACILTGLLLIRRTEQANKMHIKLEIKVDLPTHTVARALWVPEFYTLHELNDVLQASFGWEWRRPYAFISADITWLPFEEDEGENIELGVFLTEGTTLSEAMRFWEDGAVYETGCFRQWEFRLDILEVREAHPDNMTCILADGMGDMPKDSDDLRRQFLQINDVMFRDELDSTHNQVKPPIHIERTIGHCSEQVAVRSVEISKSRRQIEHS
jgi:hypothetical protein